MKCSAANASFNLAALTADARALIEADKTACLIRYRCQALKGTARQKLGQELLAGVAEAARDAVVERLKARAGK